MTQSRTAIIGTLFAILVGIVLWHPLTAYLERQSVETEKFYSALGVATLRLMDPAQRQGIELKEAYVLGGQ